MRILASLLLVLAVPAFAQMEDAKKKPRVQKMDFTEGTDIEAGTVGPEITIYEVPTRPGGFKSLIKVRMNFDDKLRDSVHEM